MSRHKSLSALALVASVVAACGGGQIPGAAAATAAAGHAPVTITVFNWGQGGDQYWEDTNKAFEAKYPWITVKAESVPFEQYLQQEGAYINSKSGPDVMANNVGLELFERKTAYLPLNDRLTPDTTAQLATYAWGCDNFDTTKSCYGLPQSFQGNVMYYNIKVLQAAGVDPKNPPATWDAFGAACDKIKATGKACIAMGTGSTVAYWDYPEIVRNYLDEKGIIDQFKGRIPWTDPRMVNTLKRLAEMADKGWFQASASTIPMLPDGGDVFTSGNAGFVASIISDVFNWKQWGDAIGNDNLGVMPWPVIEASAPLAHKFSGVEGFVHGITAWSQHPDEAFLYVAWLAGAENANLFLKEAGGQPINKTFNAGLITNSPSFTKIQTLITDPTLHAGVLLSGKEADALSRGYQQIMLKQITVDQWVQQMQAALLASPEKQP